MRHVLANQLAVVIAVGIVLLAVIFAVVQSTRLPVAGELPGEAGQPSGGTAGQPGGQDGQAAEAPVIPHALIGYENCVECHGLDGIRPYPPDHEGRPNVYCAACHTPTRVDE